MKSKNTRSNLLSRSVVVAGIVLSGAAVARAWESVSYVPQVDKWMDNYVITAEAGIDTAITKQWSLRVVFQDIYTSEPAAGTEYNELRLIAGTAYKF